MNNNPQIPGTPEPLPRKRRKAKRTEPGMPIVPGQPGSGRATRRDLNALAAKFARLRTV